MLVDAEEGGECAKCLAALRVRPAAGVSIFPLSSGGVDFGGRFCLKEGGREGGGEGSRLLVTRDETRLFLSGLQTEDG